MADPSGIGAFSMLYRSYDPDEDLSTVAQDAPAERRQQEQVVELNPNRRSQAAVPIPQEPRTSEAPRRSINNYDSFLPPTRTPEVQQVTNQATFQEKAAQPSFIKAGRSPYPVTPPKSSPSAVDDATFSLAIQHGRSQIFPKPSVTSKVSFRKTKQDQGTRREAREVSFAPNQARELEAGSTVSFFALQSTLAMAYDNERFFGVEDGYEGLLRKALSSMTALIEEGYWRSSNKETGFFGALWRFFVRLFLGATIDQVNRLRYTRGVQYLIPFLSVYEAFTLGGVIRAFDNDDRQFDRYSLSLAFKNRNTSRILVQNLSRWDWVWHLSTQITNSRAFDLLSNLPFLGFLGFPATENFPASRDHAINGILRPFLEGSWITRFITGQQSVVTFDSETAAQNLGAESTGFETANRNQYGTLFGREKTNDFRLEHRLPTDESIVRTFMTSPASTILNNGVEHVLKNLADHWKNMLYQENGNFGHQRMELLNPFEVLRFHMPILLHVLANLRGRNVWDMTTLGTFVYRLQNLNPATARRRDGADVEHGEDVEITGPCDAAQALIGELKSTIVPNVCGGVPSRMVPFCHWLDAMHEAVDELREEAFLVRTLVSTVDLGIRIGTQFLKLMDWSTPNESELKKAILCFITKKPTRDHIPGHVIGSALDKLAPKDERTLRELVMSGHSSLEACKLLLGRATTLLERELRRYQLDERMKEFSIGSKLSSLAEIDSNTWYWLDSKVVLCKRVISGAVGFVDVDTQESFTRPVDSVVASLRLYIPVAEAISRAQEVFMRVELDHVKKFSYGAFMEFGSTEKSKSLRSRLRRLLVLSQLFCSTLDNARFNVLSEVKSSVKKFKRSTNNHASRLVPTCKPQNVTVLGGGPTGLLAAIQCVHNVILSGGVVKVYEGRDAFDQEASTFERAQIVRLDSRQIAMLRFHLGTGFEDVYIPVRSSLYSRVAYDLFQSKGETDAHMGNTIPLQGFVEVTIKRLESMMLDAVIQLRSRDLLSYFAESKIEYKIPNNFTKKGAHLKVEDEVLEGGKDGRVMVVKQFTYKSQVQKSQLSPGSDYDIVLPREKQTRLFRLQECDPSKDWYHFVPHTPGVREVFGRFSSLPPVFLKGEGRVEPTTVVFTIGNSERSMPYDEIKSATFQMDFTRSHVILAIGKPNKSPVHFKCTTQEPYAVCCIEGLKISMGMHNFGEKRWGSGMIDDIRSHSDANTRVVGDFTKSIVLKKIVERMSQKIKNENAWKSHFERLPDLVGDHVPGLDALISAEVEKLATTLFRRKRLQTRFFELGNNFYLGMELPREFDEWKGRATVAVAPHKPSTSPDNLRSVRQKMIQLLPRHLDRLWYEATFEIMAEGDVYNPGGRGKIPTLYTIDQPFESSLGRLRKHDSFRLFTKKYRVQSHDAGFSMIKSETSSEAFSIPSKTYVLDYVTNAKRELVDLRPGEVFQAIDTFEVLEKTGGSSVVRSSRGFVTTMSNTVSVVRCSDLARAPDGYSESKVALASFPVAHYISHRTLRLNRVSGRGGEDGFVTAYVGDAQTSPHFMVSECPIETASPKLSSVSFKRYSGLTGACISCMSLNNMVGQAVSGATVSDRVQRLAFETTWSNGEVVQRGTGANFGQDGFVRPSTRYADLVDYLFARAVEQYEIGADLNAILSRDWKSKFSAALVPRGLELDELFFAALTTKLMETVGEKYANEVKAATADGIVSPADMRVIERELGHASQQWRQQSFDFFSGESGSRNTGLLIESVLNCLKQVIDHAVEQRQSNSRISSALFTQPNSVDSIVDDFAVEAQNFANGLTQSVALAAGSVSLGLIPGVPTGIISSLLGLWGINTSFGSMTNIARYKNRNEEMRREIFDKRMPGIMKSVFSMMSRNERQAVARENNPFMNHHGVDSQVKRFLENARYYGEDDMKLTEFQEAYEVFQKNQSVTSMQDFGDMIVSHFIPDTFHHNAYLKDDLVAIFKTVDSIKVSLINENQTTAKGLGGSSDIWQKLCKLQDPLASSIERGDIKHGFLRKHAWHQMSLPVTMRYLCSPFLGHFTVSGRIADVAKTASRMSNAGVESPSFSRTIRDLKELSFATQESQIGSVMFLSAAIVFCFNIFFSFFRLLQIVLPDSQDWVQTVVMAAGWAALGAIVGATIALFHFLRKLRHLFGLLGSVSSTNQDPRLRRVRLATKTQIALTMVRVMTVLLAVGALIWTLYANAIDRSDDPPPQAILAGIAVLMAIGAAVFFFVVEFSVRYNLAPKLGETVCEPFRSEILQIKAKYSEDIQSAIDTEQTLEAEAWAYTAREFLHRYRFDTVFAADRFSSIFQYIQSGLLEAKAK